MNSIRSNVQVHQEHLGTVIKQIFPNDEITTNVRAGLPLQNPETGKQLELDIFIPELNLCFEFQDTYHYMTMWYSQRPATHMTELDSSKQNQTRREEMTLIPVPCWWNGALSSLARSIQFYRSDLLQGQKFKSLPISLNPPLGFFAMGVPDVGEMMAASFPADIKFSEELSHENPWWLGEKYDGIRCCWHSAKTRLYSRSGRVLDLLPAYRRAFPPVFIDGEIWFGRGNFTLAQRMIKGALYQFIWAFFRVIAFDSPHIKMQKQEFEKRYKHFLQRLRKNHPFMIPAYRMLCETKKQLTNMVNFIINDGGEGVIMRHPKSIFDQGRSNLLVKIKATRGDKEGIVVSVAKKSICLKLPDGKLLAIPAHYVETPVAPRSGDIVTFTYQSFSSRAIPIHPTVVRIREDLTWEEVVANFVREKPQVHALNEDSMDSVASPRPFGYWTTERRKNLRNFFENFAKSFQMDPLISETWYNVPLSKLKDAKGGTSIIAHCKGGVGPTLVRLFPELGLEETKFPYTLMFHLNDVKKRRKWFDSLAKERGFDALIPKNWYSLIVTKELLAQGQPVLRHHSGSFVKALVHLFPEIQLDEKKFHPKTYYQDPENRKSFFTDFARANGFDPLVTKNWYKVHLSVISKFKGAWEIKHYYLSLANALVTLFPEIGADRTKVFKPLLSNWKEKAPRRKWFEELAAEYNFDPLNAEQWYNFPASIINARTGGGGILRYYKGGVHKALSDLFPEVEFDSVKFHKTPQNTLQDPAARKRIFLNFAKDKGFDPLVADNWYKVFSELLKYKGIAAVSNLHRGIVQALSDLFPDIGIEPHKFAITPKNYWQDAATRRKYFEGLAREKGKDPLVSQTWYEMKASALLSAKEMKGVLKYHHGSIAHALEDLFPDLGLSSQTLSPHYPLPANFFRGTENKRRVFEKYAREREFDPLFAENWYKVDRLDFISFPGAQLVLADYNGSMIKGAMDVFPDIGLNTSNYRQHISARIHENKNKKGLM